MGNCKSCASYLMYSNMVGSSFSFYLKCSLRKELIILFLIPGLTVLGTDLFKEMQGLFWTLRVIELARGDRLLTWYT